MEELIAQLGVEIIKFNSPELEAAFEKALTSYGFLFKTSLLLDQAKTNGNVDVAEIAGGVLKLAKEFGVYFSELTIEQVGRVKAIMKEIIKGENEALLEQYFDEALDFILSGQNVNKVGNALLATPPPA